LVVGSGQLVVGSKKMDQKQIGQLV
jgi:hypothetical protein